MVRPYFPPAPTFTLLNSSTSPGQSHENIFPNNCGLLQTQMGANQNCNMLILQRTRTFMRLPYALWDPIPHIKTNSARLFRKEKCYRKTPAPIFRPSLRRIRPISGSDAYRKRMSSNLEHLTHHKVDGHGPLLMGPIVR